MSAKLTYNFSTQSPVGAPYGELQLQNPLFMMLDAIREGGSIGRAASQLGLSYRYLWGVLKKQEAAFGQALLAGGQGQAARLSEFGERLLWAEKKMLARLLPDAESLAARIDRELMLAVDPGLRLLPTMASHDLLFGVLRERLQRHGGVLLDVEYVGSGQALTGLNEGKCSVAGIHLPLADERLCRRNSGVHLGLGRQLRLGDHKLVRFATREQGLMVSPGNPLGIASLADLLNPQVVFVNRLPGCGTRFLFDELLALNEVSPTAIRGYEGGEKTHLSVAAHIAAGDANCGFGLRAAAERFALDFVPVIREDYFIVCRKETLETREFTALIDVLRSENFRLLVAAVPGYGSEGTGEIVSLRRTLPWYK
jgi:putative molybdopterin biosynthesis protein